ncbi:MAG: hypothetical protein VYE68_03290 [Acidobacteriota bacterium]|nr:hypothetical protein [Acidobacteriota bacterium]
MKATKTPVMVALVLTSVGTRTQAGETELTGFRGLDSRAFWEDERGASQDDGFNTLL